MTRPQTAIRAIWAAALLSSVSACTSGQFQADTTPPDFIPEFVSAQIPPPPGTNPEGCWVRDVAPAEVKTDTRQIEVQPAVTDAAGNILQPARFRTETVQIIVTEREELIFETPCPEAMTTEFIATLQRALQARAFYRGPITGVLDAPTRRAVRRFQTMQGLPSSLVSIQTARRLGLTVIPRDQL